MDSFKNTTESDQETSLVQAVYKYVKITGDRSVLSDLVHGQPVIEHLERALNYVMTSRFSAKYGLVWGGVTVDWGDVQAGEANPTQMGATSDRAIGIYENAMLSIALRDLALLPTLPSAAVRSWNARRTLLDQNIQRWLWEPSEGKYRAHLYLGASPFPSSFDEDKVYLEGGTAVAIEAGLLTKGEIDASLGRMDSDVLAAHADSIGLDAFPPYPATAFPCCRSGPYSMVQYSYQNAGDWDWFGARMILDLISVGMYRQAYQEIRPMVERVSSAGGFYEWWTRSGLPRGSSQYKGSAGELGLAAEQLLSWAKHTG
jgi:hypothetical protein